MQPPGLALSFEEREFERESKGSDEAKKKERKKTFAFQKSTELFFRNREREENKLSLTRNKKTMALLASHAQCRDLVVSGRPEPCVLLELDEAVLGEVLRDG